MSKSMVTWLLSDIFNLSPPEVIKKELLLLKSISFQEEMWSEEREVSISWYDWFNARILELKNYKRCVDLKWQQLHENYTYVKSSWRNKYESNPRSYEY